MADNTTINAGSGGDSIASDDISSVKYQRIKLIYGADGVNSGDVANDNQLPVKNLPMPGVNAAATANIHVPSSNTIATVTYTAPGASIYRVIGGIAWSYSGTPTAGRLYIDDDSNVYFDIDITTSGPGFIPFNPPFRMPSNTKANIKLAAGGSGVVGKVNVLSVWTTTY